MKHNNKKASGILARICALFCVIVLTFSVSGCSDEETSNSIIESGISYTTRYVKTPKGSSVEMWVWERDLPDSELEDVTNYIKRNYPNAVMLRDATNRYNCHSYAWYSTSSSNPYWLNNPRPYMTDGSYQRVTSTTNFSSMPSTVNNNSKIVWLDKNGNTIHSGIKNDSTTVVSKWGAGGLYRHKQNYSPYTSEAVKLEYYY